MASDKYDPEAGQARLFFRFDGLEVQQDDEGPVGAGGCRPLRDDRGAKTRAARAAPRADPVAFIASGGSVVETPKAQDDLSRPLVLSELV